MHFFWYKQKSCYVGTAKNTLIKLFIPWWMQTKLLHFLTKNINFLVKIFYIVFGLFSIDMMLYVFSFLFIGQKWL